MMIDNDNYRTVFLCWYMYLAKMHSIDEKLILEKMSKDIYNGIKDWYFK